MSKQVNSYTFTNDVVSSRRRSVSMASFVVTVVGIMLAGCVTAAEYSGKPEKGDAASRQPANVPVFGPAVAKELASGGKRVTVVFAVDETGKVQAFRASETKAFTTGDLATQPLHADSISAFESLAIIKTTNPKTCWVSRNGTATCVCYPRKDGSIPASGNICDQ